MPECIRFPLSCGKVPARFNFKFQLSSARGKNLNGCGAGPFVELPIAERLCNRASNNIPSAVDSALSAVTFAAGLTANPRFYKVHLPGWPLSAKA
jgi:hypothetical protein